MGFRVGFRVRDVDVGPSSDSVKWVLVLYVELP